MNPSDLPLESQAALRRAMEFWAKRWDIECPLLFGIGLSELNQVIAQWPHVRPEASEGALLAAHSAMREILYGATAASKAQLPHVIGLSFEESRELCNLVGQAFAEPVAPADCLRQPLS